MLVLPFLFSFLLWVSASSVKLTLCFIPRSLCFKPVNHTAIFVYCSRTSQQLVPFLKKCISFISAFLQKGHHFHQRKLSSLSYREPPVSKVFFTELQPQRQAWLLKRRNAQTGSKGWKRRNKQLQAILCTVAICYIKFFPCLK